MSEIQDFYDELAALQMTAPASLEPWIYNYLKSMLSSVAHTIAKQVNPTSMSQIRDYEAENPDAAEVLRAMIGRLVNDAHNDEEDPGLQWFDYAEDIGYDVILEAPVETPQEVLEWVYRYHRLRYDQKPCAGCGKPLPYDRRYLVSDQQGRRYFHPRCGKVYSEEKRATA